MGREWYWGGKSSRRTRRGRIEEVNDTTSGCMCAVFQLFDFHQFQLPINQHRPSFSANISLPQQANVLKGVEAPRNSLETDEVSLSSMISKEEENLKIPMGIQIKTSGGSHDNNCSEMSCSPGPKTPNLVARLMGLDLVPESQSSSTSTTPSLTRRSSVHIVRPRQQKHPLNSRPRNSIDYKDVSGTRSLPETPRISSARRSDVEYHHRLSLQINKENYVNEELEVSRLTYLRRKEQLKCEDDTKSPRHYAKQIVKQVKESISRRVGLDITNTVRNRDSAREELVNQLKSKKLAKGGVKHGEESSPGRISSSSSSTSPRLRFLGSKNKALNTTSSSPKDQNHHPNIVLLKIKPQKLEEKDTKDEPVSHIKCNKAAAGERFNSRLKKPPQTSDIIRNKQEEPFVRPSSVSRAKSPDKKCKKTPLSDHLLNISAPTLVTKSLFLAPKVSKQESDAQTSKSWSQLSSCSSQSCTRQETRHTVATQDRKNKEFIIIRSNVEATSREEREGKAASTEYYQYIIRILKRAGINKDTKLSLTSWFSTSQPLDLSIFHCLELYSYDHSSRLRLRCNRKLVFQLVDELLVEILKPFIKIRPWSNVGPCRQINGSHLINNLCMKIERFPEADCKVLEDIDALIDMDMHEPKLRNLIAYEDTAEGIVTEIERHIMDGLIHEATTEWILFS